MSGEDADFARRNAAKTQLALGDVVLTAFGQLSLERTGTALKLPCGFHAAGNTAKLG